MCASRPGGEGGCWPQNEAISLNVYWPKSEKVGNKFVSTFFPELANMPSTPKAVTVNPIIALLLTAQLSAY